MKQIQDKNIYLTPEIKRNVLDNEISLQLESESTSPPWGPEEYSSNDFFDIDSLT